MTDYPRDPSLDGQVRNLQEQVRRLWTRLQTGAEPVEGWKDLNPYLNPGWKAFTTFGQDFAHPRFYKDRERVYFDGLVALDSPTATGASRSRWLDSMPDGYKPTMLVNREIFTDPDNGNGEQTWWVTEFLLGGQSDFDQHATLHGGSPLFGLPPDLTVFFLGNLSYRTPTT